MTTTEGSNGLNDVFLDTSIQIARWIHGPRTKQRIRERLREFDSTSTGLVVRHEFKERFLKDVAYLLRMLDRFDSVSRLRRHVMDVIPPQQQRKKNICLETLETLFESENEESKTERARLFLESLLEDGLKDFDGSVDRLIEESACGCGSSEIRKRRRNWEFGPSKCSRADECGIASFLGSRTSQLKQILERIQALPERGKTEELKKAEQFITAYFENPNESERLDPCTTVGDLLIAAESVGVPTFYTMNWKESEHLCRALDQNLVVSFPNPDRDDVVCRADEEDWTFTKRKRS